MRFAMIATFVLVGLLVALPLHAEGEEKDTGWSSTAEFGLVVTSGNAESETLSFKDETKRSWEESSITLKAGAVRAESTQTTRTAFGTPGSFTVDSTDFKDLSAEAYYFEGRYDHTIHERLFWFTGAGWDRNRPSGIDRRIVAFGGVGNTWRDDDKIEFRTDYALSYTDRQDVVATTGADDSFAGLRASWGYRHKFTESATYFNDLVVDYGLNESDNWRADMVNAIAVAINEKLALKVSVALLYNNLPPTTTIPLFDMPGGTQTGTVPYTLDELDTVTSAALVVNF